MRRLLAAVAAILAALTTALPADDEKPWPQKGDAVFLPFDLMVRLAPADMAAYPIPAQLVVCDNTAYCSLAIQACTRLTLDVTPRRTEAVEIRTQFGPSFRLVKDWKGPLRKTAAECRLSREDVTAQYRLDPMPSGFHFKVTDLSIDPR